MAEGYSILGEDVGLVAVQQDETGKMAVVVHTGTFAEDRMLAPQDETLVA